MQSQNKTKTFTQNNIRRGGRRRSQNPQTQQAMRASSGSCRVHRKELWFEINSTGTGRYVFEHGNYPLWFEKLSQVFESYEMHSVRIHWISGYSQFAGGSIFMSYNVNEAQKNAAFSVSSIFAQQNSGKSRLAENSSFPIPASSWRKTPNRRMCSGTGSYLFDLRYAISTSVPASPITVWIEYDVTFHTPQIETTQLPPTLNKNYLCVQGNSTILSEPQTETDQQNVTTWSCEGSFDGFVTYVAYSSSATANNTIVDAIITYEDSTTATVKLSEHNGTNWPDITYNSITVKRFDDTTINSTTTLSYPAKVFDAQKKIAKIEATLPTSSHVYFLIPY